MIWHGPHVRNILQRRGQRGEGSCTKVAVGGGCAPGCEGLGACAQGGGTIFNYVFHSDTYL